MKQSQIFQRLLEKFSVRFCQCNPSLGMNVDSVYVLCFSLILLSVDLSSPHVKNKMSKREFIKNTRGAVTESPDDDLYGSLYGWCHFSPNKTDKNIIYFRQRLPQRSHRGRRDQARETLQATIHSRLPSHVPIAHISSLLKAFNFFYLATNYSFKML